MAEVNMHEFNEPSKVTLEDLVDRLTLNGVLVLLADICHEKAQHIDHTWQDDNLSGQWDKRGFHINQLANAPRMKEPK